MPQKCNIFLQAKTIHAEERVLQALIIILDLFSIVCLDCVLCFILF